MFKRLIPFLLLLTILSACTRSANAPAPLLTPVGVILPTPNPAETFLPPTRVPGSPIFTPTPNPARALPTPIARPGEYIIQPGDTLGQVARAYGLSLEALIAANPGIDPNWLAVGQVIKLPGQESASGITASGSGFKIIPDSELVYGPVGAALDIADYVRRKGGYLNDYTQDVDGVLLSGPQIVQKVALNYSVNPRLLLAILEYQSGWVTRKNITPTPNPIHAVDDYHTGLYRQLTWTADALNYGFYNFYEGRIANWTLADGTVVPLDPGINPGTAAVQHFFALIHGADVWPRDVSIDGLFATFFLMFGYPFDLAIEPLLPPALAQPPMQLPFEPGKVWYFTGGPHGGWDTGSAWAALDFAPPGEPLGCTVSADWVTAVADGLVVRSDNGVVMQDLDGDGYEQTGWNVMYLHVSERAPLGTYLRAGDRVGRASCEGGFSMATHVHIARKYNGMWISAEGGGIPFVLDGWTASGAGREYDGYLNKGSIWLEAWDGQTPLNEISRP